MNWIKCSESKPKEDQEVLTLLHDPGAYGELYYLAEYQEGYGWWETTECKRIEVTHWMPLPQPPKDEHLSQEEISDSYKKFQKESVCKFIPKIKENS